MGKAFTQDERQEVIKRYLNGEKVLSIAQETQISKSTIYQWIKEYHSEKGSHPRNYYHLLEMKYERLERIIQILQNAPCTASAPLHARLRAIEFMSGEYNINNLCFALKVAKGTFYNHILRNKKENTSYAQRRAELTPIIERIYHENREIYGPDKIAVVMKDRGYKISRRMVARIMRENGFFSVRSSAKTMYEKYNGRRENLLNQNFTASRPNEVWVSDVTYYCFKEKTYYICAIIDLFSRKVVAHKVSHRNSTQLTKSTFQLAYNIRKPQEGLLFHSDNGSNYISKEFTGYLKRMGVVQSYSKKKTPYDNSVCESYFGTMKMEELYRSKYRSEKELRKAISDYIEFYNSKRPHSVLRYMTPDKFEEVYYKMHPADRVQ